MSDIIKLLPDSVANQIAAGEVIQRPASVVKELMENAIDAGASTINVNIKEAGRTLIQVNDNGCGMSPADASMAFERHATSKISVAKDLFAIRTLGFRGEALPSIASVSELKITSSNNNNGEGYDVFTKGGEVIKKSVQNHPNPIMDQIFYYTTIITNCIVGH